MTDRYHADIDAIASYEGNEHGPRFTRYGSRREAAATCYWCGADVPDGPRFGRETTCDDCVRAGRGPVAPWLAGKETR